MTVQDQTTKKTATGDGSATTFSFSPMVIFSSADLYVVTTVIATGVETVRTEGTGSTNWSLGITSFPATGSITYPADEVTPLPATEKLTIKRVLTLEQQTNLDNQGGYHPDIQERQFDKLVMIDLQQQEELDRTIKFVLSADLTSFDEEIPAPEASKSLAINSGLTGWEWVDNAASAVTAAAASAAAAAASETAAAASETAAAASETAAAASETAAAASAATAASATTRRWVVPVTSDTVTLTAGTGKKTFRAPHAITLTEVRASLVTASSSGGPVTVDINESGSTILSTKLTIDDTEKTSETAATAAVISDTAIADDAEITIDIDDAGSGAKGLSVTFIGTVS